MPVLQWSAGAGHYQTLEHKRYCPPAASFLRLWAPDLEHRTPVATQTPRWAAAVWQVLVGIYTRCVQPLRGLMVTRHSQILSQGQTGSQLKRRWHIRGRTTCHPKPTPAAIPTAYYPTLHCSCIVCSLHGLNRLEHSFCKCPSPGSRSLSASIRTASPHPSP